MKKLKLWENGLHGMVLCNVDTLDNIPKTIDNCDNEVGDVVTVKYGRDMAFAEIVNP